MSKRLKNKDGASDNETDGEDQNLLSSSLVTSSSIRNYGSRRPMHYSSINYSPNEEESSVRNAAVLSRYKYYSRLAPHSNSIMMIPDHVVPPEFWSYLPVSPDGKQSSLITIFSIWNTMMGTSLLSMPWALSHAGFGLGLTLMIVMAFLTLYTSYRIIKSLNTIDNCGSNEVLEFSDVCKHYLGKPGEICAVLFSVIALLGGAIVYWVLMSNFLFNAVNFVHNIAEPGPHKYPDELNYSLYHDDYIHCPSHSNKTTSHSDSSLPASDSFEMYWDIQKTVPFFLSIFLATLVNFKSPTFFTKFNALGTISILYLLGFITYKTALWGFHLDFSQVPGTNASMTFPALTGVLSLAYFIHNCVLSIVRNQAKPENNGRDLTIAFICVATTYCYVAGMFYSAWPMISKDCIDQNLLNNFLPEDPLAFIARIFLFLQMVTVFPLLLYIMRIQVMHVMYGSVWPSWKHVVCLNILVFGVCLIFARFLPQIGSIIRYTGAFCGLVYAFFLPCSTYLLYEKHSNNLSLPKLIIHIFLICVGLANFIAQFLIS